MHQKPQEAYFNAPEKTRTKPRYCTHFKDDTYFQHFRKFFRVSLNANYSLSVFACRS